MPPVYHQFRSSRTGGQPSRVICPISGLIYPRLVAMRFTLALVLVLGFAGCRTNDQVERPTSTQPPPGRDSSPATQPDPTPAEEADPGAPPLTREEIRVVVRAKMPFVRACFDAGLSREPGIGGRITLRFTIGPEGRVDAVEIVEDELGEPSVATCLAESITTWQFPRPRGGRSITIAYPFVFSSEDALRAAGLPRVEGTVKPAAVGAVFEARRAELDGCVPEGARGSVGLALTIDDSGAVTRISSYASTLDDEARACIVRTVSSWVFPPAAADDEARVNHDLRW
jgi:hypothetical protein